MNITFAEALAYSVLGFAIVFLGLILLMFVIQIMGAIMRKSKAKAQPAPAAAAPAAPAPAPQAAKAPGSAGQVKLYTVSDKEAAMIMAIVADKMRLRDALKRAFSCKAQRFAGLFSTYLVTVLLIMCVNVLFAVATFGAGLLITIPMSYLMMTCIQFVSYYDDTHKKYFLGEDNIVRPKERTNENFYDDFEL